MGTVKQCLQSLDLAFEGSGSIDDSPKRFLSAFFCQPKLLYLCSRFGTHCRQPTTAQAVDDVQHVGQFLTVSSSEQPTSFGR